MKQKVCAYILHEGDTELELLVFEHLDGEAGVQIPAGTVEGNEKPEAAVHRELSEESGVVIPTFTLLKTVPPPWEGDPDVEAHFFGGWAPVNIHKEWIHEVTGTGEDKGMRFHYYWLPLSQWDKLYGDFKLPRKEVDAYIQAPRPPEKKRR